MLRTILRYLWYTALRVHDAVIGPQLAVLRRLERKGRVEIGPHTRSYGIPTIRSYVHDQTRLIIGDYCSIANDAIVMIGGRHATKLLTTYPHRINWGMEGAGQDGFPEPSEDTVIGADVWLCPGSIVLTGVRIGHGAIVGAGTVVVKDIPDYAIVGGNPAQVIRYRFSEEEIEDLLAIRWWDWPEEMVRKAVPLLTTDDVAGLVAFAKEHDLVPQNPPVRDGRPAS